VDKHLLKEFEDETANLIMSASEVVSNTKSAVKRALFSKVKEIKKNGEALWETPSTIKEDKELFYELSLAFWQVTESAFYQSVIGIKACLESGEVSLGVKAEWHRSLINASENMYSTYVMASAIGDTDPKRVVIARRELGQYNRSKKIKGLLGIPIEQPGPGKKAKVKKNQKQAEIAFGHQ
ncbi:MAG: hypothetical protein L7F78_25560, partial [Syntrophales bacterium LBB04]|nr:hypothetical protein [Syntrophales bacterium LBB04]